MRLVFSGTGKPQSAGIEYLPSVRHTGLGARKERKRVKLSAVRLS